MIRKYTAQDIEIAIDESNERVFHPHPITHMLANAIQIKTTDIVLEIGCGSGLIAMTAVKLGAKHVYASDIAVPAVQATQANMALNGIDGRMTVVQGDWFEPFKGMKFDVIVSNPPCMPFPEGAVYQNEGLTLAVNSGHDGAHKLLEILLCAPEYLGCDGKLYIPTPHWSNLHCLLNTLDAHYHHSVIATGVVPYYLAGWDRIFLDHILQLEEEGVVSMTSRDLPFARVDIRLAIPRRCSGDKSVKL